MAKAQSELTETLQGFYESSDPMYQATVQMQYCMQDIDAARLALVEFSLLIMRTQMNIH